MDAITRRHSLAGWAGLLIVACVGLAAAGCGSSSGGAGLADAGVASEPAALPCGLAFIPLAAERFDLVIPADLTGSREVQGLLKVLSSRWLLDQLASLPGYDATTCGEHVATIPARQ
jgi:PBP superfamily domain